jgi:hypothetical protein
LELNNYFHSILPDKLFSIIINYDKNLNNNNNNNINKKIIETEKEEKSKKIIKEQIKKQIIRNRIKNYMNKEEYKESKQRIKLIKELLETERTFVKFLKELIEEYYIPLRKKNILDDKEINTIFSNIEEISNFNSKFFIEIENEFLNFPVFNISNIFLNNSLNFEIYKIFVNNYDNSTEGNKNLLIF